MNITIAPGTYILAVSGGVDSMVLLDLLAKHKADNPDPINLIIAHYDHGIRSNSKADRLFVQRAAKVYRLPFTFDQGILGPDASEAVARLVRYKFLEAARQAANAQAIITAHHQDDQLETAFINTLRGTGRRGLTALGNRTTVLRPLLKIPKSELIAYAEANNLGWQEDSTNHDTRYTRNHVRHRLLPTLSETEKGQLVETLAELTGVNSQIDNQLVNHLHTQPVAGELDRHWYIMLPHTVSSEIMMTWLRSREINDLDKKRLSVIVVKSKTLGWGKKIVVNSKYYIKVGKYRLALAALER